MRNSDLAWFQTFLVGDVLFGCESQIDGGG